MPGSFFPHLASPQERAHAGSGEPQHLPLPSLLPGDHFLPFQHLLHPADGLGPLSPNKASGPPQSRTVPPPTAGMGTGITDVPPGYPGRGTPPQVLPGPPGFVSPHSSCSSPLTPGPAAPLPPHLRLLFSSSHHATSSCPSHLHPPAPCSPLRPCPGLCIPPHAAAPPQSPPQHSAPPHTVLGTVGFP